MSSCKWCMMYFYQWHKSLENSLNKREIHSHDLKRKRCLKQRSFVSCKLSKFQTEYNQWKPRNYCMGRTFSIQFHKQCRQSAHQHRYILSFCLHLCLHILWRILLLYWVRQADLLWNHFTIRKLKIKKEYQW